jgi:predicted phage terminase large subunit-like protein
VEFSVRNGFIPAKHHQLIIEHLEALERGDITRLMISTPPGAAKSTYCSLLFPAWFMGRNPKSNIIFATHTQEFSERWGRKVRNMVASQDFKETFGFSLADDSQAAGRWENSQGGDYFATSVGGAVTGRRGDIVLCDDLLRGREDADSETIRAKQWAWWVDDLSTRLKPNSKQLVIATRWREDDVLGRILDREGDKWKVINLEMECTKEDDPLGRKVGERLWPEWFTDEMVERAKMDNRGWQCLYQGNPTPAGGTEFKRTWLEYYDTPPDRKNITTLMVVDPANDKSKRADYTAIWVIGVGGDDNFYVLDMVRDRLNLAERIDTVFQLHRKYRPVEVRFERFGMQTDIDYLKIEMDRRSYRFRVREVAGTRISKEDRIRRLVPYFRNRRIIFPHEFMYTNTDGDSRDLVKHFIDEELVPFPLGKHDDMIDSLSRIAEPGLVLPKHVDKDELLRETKAMEGAAFEPFDPEFAY